LHAIVTGRREAAGKRTHILGAVQHRDIDERALFPHIHFLLGTLLVL